MIKNLGEVGLTLQNIVNRLLANQKLLKLLYYTEKDPYSEIDLTNEMIKDEVFNKLIKIVPYIGQKENSLSMITLSIINGSVGKNDQFSSLMLVLDVFVPLSQWIIKDSNLRPFAIMGEIQNSLDNKNINGVGKLVGGDFELTALTDEMSIYTLTYSFEQFR